jgi:hypothetical protein
MALPVTEEQRGDRCRQHVRPFGAQAWAAQELVLRQEQELVLRQEESRRGNRGDLPVPPRRLSTPSRPGRAGGLPGLPGSTRATGTLGGLADLLRQLGCGEEAERLRRFGLNPDRSTASGVADDGVISRPAGYRRYAPWSGGQSPPAGPSRALGALAGLCPASWVRPGGPPAGSGSRRPGRGRTRDLPGRVGPRAGACRRGQGAFEGLRAPSRVSTRRMSAAVV